MRRAVWAPPAQAAARLLGLAAAALALAALHPAHRPATLCLVRGLTGLPCPLCGGTTAAVRLGHGHLGAALAASPLAVLGGASLALRPLVPAAAVARLSTERLSTARLPLLVGALVAAELWQLHRFR